MTRTLNLAVVLEFRFEQTPDGALWTNSAFARPFWERYLKHFEEVSIVARANQVESPSGGTRLASGDRVGVCAIPHFVGPAGFARRSSAVRAALAEAVASADAVVLRAPGTLATVAQSILTRQQVPYAVEVVGDPHDVFAPGVVPHPGRAFFRWWYARGLRAACDGAAVAAYVTEHALQRRYPPGAGTFATHYSDVELDADAFVEHAPTPRGRGPFTLLTVASMEQPYKAIDVQLAALQALRARGVDARLRVVGEGRLRASLEALADDLGVAEAATFVGNLPGAPAVRAELDRADLFLLPSRTEGLPRALVEAMARGLPAVGSRVGGIPELLPPGVTVAPDDVAALTELVASLLADPARRAALGEANLRRASDFEEMNLARRRDAAYAYLAAAARPDAL